MRKLLSVLLAFLVVSGIAIARQIRTEDTSPALPAADGRPNSDAVADVYAIRDQFARVLLLRFKYQTDLLAGFENIVEEQKIRNVVILAGAGSVRDYHFHVVSNRTFPSRNIFVKGPTAQLLPTLSA
jgi:hypothetical protein